MNIINQKYDPQLAITTAGKVIGTVLTSLNEIADYHMTDSYQALFHTPWYKQGIKKKARQARKEMDKVINVVYKNLKKENDGVRFYSTYVDCFRENITPFIERLQNEIEGVIAVEGEKHAHFFAMMKTTENLLILATDVYDSLCRTIRAQHGYDITKDFINYSPYRALKAWSELVDMIPKGFSINLKEHPEILVAYDAIHNNFITHDYVTEVSEKTVSQLEEEDGIAKKGGEDE